MFRRKESSNRIELSRLVQELLNFGVLGSLWLWGVGGGWGVPHTHVHMHTHTHTCTCMCGKHDNFMQMATPIGGIHGNSLWCHMCMGMPACACMCTCVEGTLSPPRTPSNHPHPNPTTPHPPGGPLESKFNSTWTNQHISILFEDLKSVETPPPKGGCIVWWLGGLVGGWVSWWVGSGQITKNLKIVDWIKIIQFCLKIYHL